MDQFIVSFEFVNPEEHPEHYCPAHGKHPRRAAADVPEEHWTSVVKRHLDHPSAVGHYRGLNVLVEEGELIRNIMIRSVVESTMNVRLGEAPL